MRQHILLWPFQVHLGSNVHYNWSHVPLVHHWCHLTNYKITLLGDTPWNELAETGLDARYFCREPTRRELLTL
jgi:hypothetical protein